MNKGTRTFGYVRTVAVALALGLTLVMVTACGSSSNSNSNSNKTAGGGSSNASASSSPSSSSDVTEAKQGLQAAYAGDFTHPPTSSPKPQAGKNVWIIPCSLEAVGCLNTEIAASQAAKAIGWTVHVVDGQFTPSVYNQDIREAIAAKANGIILDGENCTDAPAAIRAATAAGIKVVDEGGTNCSSNGFSAYPTWAGGKTQLQLASTATQQARADWIIANTDGKANVVFVRLVDNPIAQTYAAGLTNALGKCSGCTVTDVDVTTSDYATGKVEGIVSTALVQHPTANVVVSAFDALDLAGVSAAVRSAGRKLLSIGNDGEPEMVDLVREGQASGTPVLFLGWSGYGVVDVLNRAFHGTTGPVEEGDGFEFFDKTHAIPSGDLSLTGPTKVPWKADYMKDWGVG